ncbi:hypothetical protein [Streptomyces bacillaris]|uniref:hypothetical protein n=1 Tax=Streptomyces bacillaris TaxID=68179 RepID=UPI00345FACFF
MHATVVPAPDATVRAGDPRAWVREQRGPMYEPVRIDFVDTLPLTDAGKPDKKLLQNQAQQRTAATTPA